MKRIYLSGPMTGLPGLNFAAFHAMTTNLRAGGHTVTNPADRPILLKTEMVAGHGGVSGRYKAWKERAFQLAWLLHQVGIDA